jgi:hypothetical protein
MKAIQKLIADGQIEIVGDGERVSTKESSGSLRSRTQGGAKSFRRVQGDR